jgi:hypothetical protein
MAHAHHLVDPVACTATSGCENGQVEIQVGLVPSASSRRRLRLKTDEELNA